MFFINLFSTLFNICIRILKLKVIGNAKCENLKPKKGHIMTQYAYFLGLYLIRRPLLGIGELHVFKRQELSISLSSGGRYLQIESYLNKDWECVILREIDFLWKICWSIPFLHPSWKIHTWIEICASLNHRKKTKADCSQLIPRKHTETRVRLSDSEIIVLFLRNCTYLVRITEWVHIGNFYVDTIS